jgi:MFS family permease
MGASGDSGWRPGELHLYYALVGLYFFSFGVQIVLFPSLAAFTLDASEEGVGIAQMALSAPMFVLLLFGGALAERVRAGTTLAMLQATLAAPMLTLAWVVWNNALTYQILIFYAIATGTLAAMILPVRDAALNGVVERDAARGRRALLARAAATTAAVQIGAQIVGIIAGRLAGATPAVLLVAQATALILSALLCLGLKAPKPEPRGKRGLFSALSDIREGLVYAFKSPIMGPMLGSAAYMGVFVVGSFQVLFPLIVREAYPGSPVEQSKQLGWLFACFWGACFISAALLSRLPPLRRPGRTLVLSHAVGAIALISFAFHKPFWLFGLIVFLWGLAGGVSMSASRTLTQAAAEPRFLGRVLAVYSMGFMGGAPIGSALVGYASALMNPRLAALIPGFGLAIAIALLVVFSPIWKLHATQLRA